MFVVVEHTTQQLKAMHAMKPPPTLQQQVTTEPYSANTFGELRMVSGKQVFGHGLRLTSSQPLLQNGTEHKHPLLQNGICQKKKVLLTCCTLVNFLLWKPYTLTSMNKVLHQEQTTPLTDVNPFLTMN